MAIGFFPSPYPDELLYSLCARYAHRVQYPSASAINLELFGNETTAAIIDLPCRVSKLAAMLPQGHSLTSDSLIDNHTLLKFYAPFLPPERLCRIRTGMKGLGSSTIHELAGISASTIRNPDWLRFCPRCVRQDRRTFGECYWHRIHQVPGVLACPRHKVFLENSKARVRRRTNKVEYIHAEHAVFSILPRPVRVSDSSQELLLKLTHDVAWLLARELTTMKLETMHQCFVSLLISRNLASRTGLIKRRELAKVLREVYSPALLDLLQCDFDEEKKGNWPVLILSHLKKATVNHPLRYLLLIHLLGHTAESFFDLCMSTATKGRHAHKPFGRGPWPCLNPTCVNHRKLVIEAYQNKRPQSDSYQASGIFSCSCGFSYLRHWSDPSSDNRFRYYRVQSYGPVWEAQLRKLWVDPSISLASMVGRLGANEVAIKKQAALLGLSASRVGNRNRTTFIGAISKNIEKERRTKTLRFAKERKSRRMEFLAIRRKYPTASRSELQDIAARVYIWLYRNDKKWLDDHLPLRRKRDTYTRRPLYWADRDALLEKEVRLAASMLRNVDGRPVRVSAVAIIRYIDGNLRQSKSEVRLINSKWFLDRVPLTAKALREVTETTLEHQRRKLMWASERFCKEGVSPPRWKLMDYAGVSRNGMTAPLAALVEETLSSIRKVTTIISYRAA